ncbi:hypothetical protein Q6346_15255 [Isoptericola sp. b490]|uniref:HNH endonuclease n=1 Tax=Actinotalea lenta TaxID=3064654 RepID=UPI00271229B1|nr:hypothetical protein [Isoptericola sp. b490]MDO8122665.1 hypothetical protein [Isoptericola sp. b490]
MTSTTVRYNPRGTNRPLRTALYDAWRGSCYWCTRTLQLDQAEIDHIIPQAAVAGSSLSAAFGLPEDFDVHDPGNLAPICGPCNKAKRALDLTKTPVVATRMEEAKRKRSRVIADVEAMVSGRLLARHFTGVRTASLNDPATRAVFLAEAPFVVQRLAAEAPTALDYRTTLIVEGQDYDEHGAPPVTRTVSATLDNHGRDTQLVLAHVCGADLADLLDQIARETCEQLEEEYGSWGETAGESPELISWGELDTPHQSITFDRVAFEESGDTYTFTATGEAQIVFRASGTRSDSRGDELEDLQGEAWIVCRTTAQASWTRGDVLGDVLIDEVALSDVDVNSWVE